MCLRKRDVPPKEGRIDLQVINQAAHVADGEGDVLFRQRPVAGDVHRMIVVDDAIVADFVDRAQHPSQLDEPVRNANCRL